MTEQKPAPTAHVSVEALFRDHASFVATFLHRLGAPRGEIEDLVQEVFCIAHRKGGYEPGPAHPRSWLGAIALRVARTGRRTLSRTESPDSPAVNRLITHADAIERIDTRRSISRVERALDSLPLEQRAAFVLFEIEGESCESIAAVWNVPVGTVYSRLHHARRKFLQVYAAQGGCASDSPIRTAGGKR
jgi:RNA polymerase sigma-70 factor, ECF subfamily